MRESTGDDQKKEANATPAKEAAEAAKLRAEAEAAKAEAEKSRAEARSAEATARKTEAELADRDTPAAQRQRSAEAEQATAEAEKAAADARRAEISALIPDLKDVDRGELTVSPEKGLLGPALAQAALDDASATIAEHVVKATSGIKEPLILVTTDGDLAASDAAYWEVTTGLEQLIDAADKLDTKLNEPEPELDIRIDYFIAPIVPILGAIASALPPVLSLFSAHRTLSTSPLTVSDVAASAAVAGALLKNESISVVHDDFRLLEEGRIHDQIRALSEKRQLLIDHKLALDQTRTEQEAEVAILRDRIEQFTKDLVGATKAKTAQLKKLLDEARTERAIASRKAGEAATKIGVVETVLTAIDSFTASLVTVPSGAKWSTLTAATRREQLHGDKGFTHALLIKAAAGSTFEVLNDKPLWFDDKLTALAAISVTYMLLQPKENRIVAAGAAAGSVDVTGRVGEEFEISTRVLAEQGSGS